MHPVRSGDYRRAGCCRIGRAQPPRFTAAALLLSNGVQLRQGRLVFTAISGTFCKTIDGLLSQGNIDA
jgi:hypothetical protein